MRKSGNITATKEETFPTHITDLLQHARKRALQTSVMSVKQNNAFSKLYFLAFNSKSCAENVRKEKRFVLHCTLISPKNYFFGLNEKTLHYRSLFTADIKLHYWFLLDFIIT